MLNHVEHHSIDSDPTILISDAFLEKRSQGLRFLQENFLRAVSSQSASSVILFGEHRVCALLLVVLQ